MNEYQYDEFAAIERPLTKDEMAELRARRTVGDLLALAEQAREEEI